MINKKLKTQLWMAWVVIIFSLLLLAAGFVVAPMGIIDISVVGTVSMCFAFVGALVGIDYKYDFEKQINKLKGRSNNKQVD